MVVLFTEKKTRSANVIGELKGNRIPEEIVIATKACESFKEVEIIQKNGIKLKSVIVNSITITATLRSLIVLFIEHPLLLQQHLNKCYKHYNN